MLVSVVVPAYNEENYLGACLDALCAQAHPGFDYEIIVVDDGSADRTRQIALARGVRVISQPNRGVSAARQAGFEAARGEIIASTDADTLPPPDWLCCIVVALAQYPQAVAVCGTVRLYGARPFEQFVSEYVSGTHMRALTNLGHPLFSAQNFAVRRSAWQQAGGFDRRWASGEDVLFSDRVGRIGRVRFEPHLVMPASARRLRKGYLAVLRYGFLNYLRVALFHRTDRRFGAVR